MYTSCWLLPWYYYCDVRLYYCDIRTTFISDNSTIWWNNSITQKMCNMKYTWLPFLVLPPSGYSIWGTENWLCPVSLSFHDTTKEWRSLFWGIVSYYRAIIDLLNINQLLMCIFTELHSDLEKLEKPKMYVLVSTVMTWAKSKPLDPVSLY